MLIVGGDRKMLKKKLLISILIISLLMPSLRWAQVYEPYELGLLEEETQMLIVEGQMYPLYKLGGIIYMPLMYLFRMGLCIEDKPDYTVVHYPEEMIGEGEIDFILLKDEPARLSNRVIYMGSLRTYAIEAKGELLVPLASLEIFWKLLPHQGTLIAENYWHQMNRLIHITPEMIESYSEAVLNVELMHIFWNGNTFETEEIEVILEPYEKKSLFETNLQKKDTYMTSVIMNLNGVPMVIGGLDRFYGQCNEQLFKRYEREKRKAYLVKVFPSYKVLGKMRYGVGALTEGEEVTVWRSEKSYYYMVKDKAGNKVQVPYNSISLLGATGGSRYEAKDEDIEDFATLSEIESETDYLLWTDLARQRTYILKTSEGNWHLEKKFKCSSGRDQCPTPTGFFKVEYGIPFFGLNKNFRCKNAMVFFKDYMYHSILFDKTGQYIKSGQYDLGRAVSHGCIRLSEEDSAWIYNNVPIKTTVWIR